MDDNRSRHTLPCHNRRLGKPRLANQPCAAIGAFEMTELPGRPSVGPAHSYFHGIWAGGSDDGPIEWFDELDASRWSIRCVRKYRTVGSKRLAGPAMTGGT